MRIIKFIAVNRENPSGSVAIGANHFMGFAWMVYKRILDFWFAFSKTFYNACGLVCGTVVCHKNGVAEIEDIEQNPLDENIFVPDLADRNNFVLIHDGVGILSSYLNADSPLVVLGNNFGFAVKVKWRVSWEKERGEESEAGGQQSKLLAREFELSCQEVAHDNVVASHAEQFDRQGWHPIAVERILALEGQYPFRLAFVRKDTCFDTKSRR